MTPITKKIKNDYSEITDDEQGMPRISLVIPYSLKMKKQPDLFNFMTAKVDKIEKEILMKCPEEKAVPLIKKLRHLIKGMKCRSDGKTVGIFVSSLAAKIYYFTPSHLEEHKLPVLVHREEESNSSDLKQ